MVTRDVPWNLSFRSGYEPLICSTLYSSASCCAAAGRFLPHCRGCGGATIPSPEPSGSGSLGESCRRRRASTPRSWTSAPSAPVFTLPGKKNIGLGRHWHGLGATLWLINGLVYVVLLFATGLW